MIKWWTCSQGSPCTSPLAWSTRPLRAKGNRYTSSRYSPHPSYPVRTRGPWQAEQGLMTETPVRVSPAPVTSVKGSELNEDASYRPYGATTFASCPIGTIETIRTGEAVVLGVPYERTKISRPGASEGPKAIREATAMFGFAVESMAGGVIADLDSGVSSR